MTIEKDKKFYLSVISIALPIALQNLITFANSMMDTIMLGQADASGLLLSASSLANQPFFILTLACFGMAGGATVLISQYWGKRDMAPIRRIVSMMLRVALAVSCLFALAVLLLPEQVMALYSARPDVIDAGASYLRILGYAYVLFGVSNTLLCMLRGVELVRISAVVNAVSFVINTGLNWVLIFGRFGMPALGIRGAAIASLTARAVEFLIIVIYVFVVDKRLGFRLRHLRLTDRLLARDLLVHGSPVLINEVMWAVGSSVQAAILGHITYTAGDPVAANSIAGMVQQLSTVVIFGLANAAAVVVGRAIGEGDRARAMRQAHTLKYGSVLVGLLACGLILLLRDMVVEFYDFPEATKQLARELIDVVAVITIFVAMSSMFIIGILRGAGDTRFCLVAEMACLWGASLPLAAAAAMWLKLPVPVVLVCMKIDEPLKSALCFLRMRGEHWLRSLTRD